MFLLGLSGELDRTLIFCGEESSSRPVRTTSVSQFPVSNGSVEIKQQDVVERDWRGLQGGPCRPADTAVEI